MARPMSRLQLRDEARNLLAETGTGFYTDAQLNQWLADGVDELALRLEPITTNGTFDVAANQGEYLLPDHLISIRKAFFKDSSSNWLNLEETTYENLFESDPDWEDDSSDPPSQWYWRQDYIGLQPIPKTTRAAALRLYYTARPDEMAGDASTTGLPSYLDRGVVLWAVYKARLKDRDLQRANGALAEFRVHAAQGAVILNKHRKGGAPKLVFNQRPYRLYWMRRRRSSELITISD